jgi:hypothetical protein
MSSSVFANRCAAGDFHEGFVDKCKGLYCKPNTSRRKAKHKIWLYLLRGLKINRANQAWALDTTYIPTARGFA